MAKILVAITCVFVLGACSHFKRGHSTAGKGACCAEGEMECCKDAKAKGKDCDKC